MTRIGIAQLGACNRRSIAAALERAGASVCWIESAQEIAGCDGLVLPGVANAGYVIAEVERRGLRDALYEACTSGMPVLGICAGFQLLYEYSEEAPQAAGLGIFVGGVRKLQTPRVPHMGWNFASSLDETAFASGWAYFAHTYAPELSTQTIAITRDGEDAFASAARCGNVTGVQFHPERSAAYGTALLERFVKTAALAYAG